MHSINNVFKVFLVLHWNLNIHCVSIEVTPEINPLNNKKSDHANYYLCSVNVAQLRRGTVVIQQ